MVSTMPTATAKKNTAAAPVESAEDVAARTLSAEAQKLATLHELLDRKVDEHLTAFGEITPQTLSLAPWERRFIADCLELERPVGNDVFVSKLCKHQAVREARAEAGELAVIQAERQSPGRFTSSTRAGTTASTSGRSSRGLSSGPA
jgi:hypothetical protein